MLNVKFCGDIRCQHVLNCLGLCVCYFLCLHIMAWDEWLIWFIKVCFEDTTFNIIWILVHLILICVIHGKKNQFHIILQGCIKVWVCLCVCACVYVCKYIPIKTFCVNKICDRKKSLYITKTWKTWRKERKAHSSFLLFIFVLHIIRFEHLLL